MGLDAVIERLDTYRDDIIELERELVAIPALSPEYGAPPEQTGETRKVEFLERYLRGIGIESFEKILAPDPRAPSGDRPSMIARVKGRRGGRTVWVMVHTDVVPPGDPDKWTGDPWTLRVDGDRIFGRGVEDNHQGLVAGVMALRAILETGSEPTHDLAILFVADEECGSEYGICHVLESAKPFGPEDLIVVPDGGAPDGTEIEVAEKSIMWARFEITGVQCHASIPGKGVNAMRAGANLVVRLDRLRERFDREDPLFEPPESTFEPTKKEANVPNVNAIPGEDVFYFDCRILPDYPLAEVEAAMREICDGVERELGVTVKMSFEQREEAAPPTPEDAPIVGLLEKAIGEVYGVEARAVGVGGGTVAAYLRREGLPCVVWARMEETMHGPDESALVSNIVGDAKVIAHLMLSE